MNHHKNAALTVRQRTQIAESYRQGTTITALAKQFGVNRTTIRQWAKRQDPTDRSSAPHCHGRQVVTPDYQEAVLALRQAHPAWGPRRIADQLKEQEQTPYPTANVATVWRILHRAGLSHPKKKKTPA